MHIQCTVVMAAERAEAGTRCRHTSMLARRSAVAISLAAAPCSPSWTSLRSRASWAWGCGYGCTHA